MLKATYHPLTLRFLKPAGTSRGTLLHKTSWFIKIWDETEPDLMGIGECSLIPGLSPDPEELIEQELEQICSNIHTPFAWVQAKGASFPSIKFGLETALADFALGGKQTFGNNAFANGTAGIPINGLIWMGSKQDILQQIRQKIDNGFSTIKIKVGALDFEQECEILDFIRKHFDKNNIEIRLDANGAFSPTEALSKLETLAKFNIHSIEQPIKPGQHELMAALCAASPIDIALDEELIGIYDNDQRNHLLAEINPKYIILKPSLLGGLEDTLQWTMLAQSLGIGWWVTSALESNIGLNAIAHWTFANAPSIHQGLGTGQLYANNIASPLEIRNGKLYSNPSKTWDLSLLKK